MVLGSGGVWKAIVNITLNKRIAQKLRIIILLHFGLDLLVTCRFHFGENPKTRDFHDFRTCPWLPEPIIFNLWDTKILQETQENTKAFQKNVFGNSRILEIANYGKDARPQIPMIRFINSWKAWVWDQNLSTNMKWKIDIYNWRTLNNRKLFLFSIEGMVFSIGGT